MKTVSLLCRGESLKYIDKLSRPDQCVIVNAFHYELEHEPVNDYVSKCGIVTHILSIGAYHPAAGADKIYKNYNFNKIVVPYIKDVAPYIPERIRNIEGVNGILPVEYLDDINKKDMISHPRYAFTSPTCGLDALLYCVNQLKPDIINIIGLDFYDNVGYFTNSFGSSEHDAPNDYAVARGESTAKMQEFFINVVNANEDIQFNLYTKSNINVSLNNLKVNYYE